MPAIKIFGKVCIVVILGIVLVLGPMAMIGLNRRWGLPSWQTAAGVVVGNVLTVSAVVVWAYCSRLFSRIGKGTPFVTDPPTRLVMGGAYRYSRNPIYLAHVGFLLGWVLRSGCLLPLLYTVLITALIQAAIVWWEEPGLRARFGEAYVRYTEAVPRWLLLRPRRRLTSKWG